MRKIFKKIAAVAAAATMVMAMATTAFAAEDTYNVAGAEGLCGVNWAPDQNQMDKNDDGTWSKEFKDIKAGTYEFKVVQNGAWGNPDFNLEGSAANGGANASVKVEKDGSTVIVTFDGEKAGVKVVEPETQASSETEAPTTTVAPSKDNVPPTGDSTAVIAMLAVAAVAGALVVATKKQTVNE